MSGIFGIFNRDGAPVEEQELAQMAEVMGYRGPDGVRWQQHGAVGLGHLMLWTTPESLQETLPLENASGQLILTADARIDNRAELIATFGWKDRPALEISDSQLILAAYEKWGTACPKHLLGDFAFAIWDAHQQQLFCAVDPIAVRPLCYFYTATRFVFGSEIKALHTLPDAPRAINEARIASHLTLVPCHEPGETFYQGIYRLPPGQCLTVTRAELHSETYWQLDPERTIHLPSDQAYAEAFREIFSKAVRCRLRSAYPQGVQLSGGLDSCSVTAMARQLLPDDTPLSIFSAYFDGPSDTDERPYVNDLLALGNYEPYSIDGNRIDPTQRIEEFLSYQDEPLFNSFIWVDRHLQGLAHEQGVRIMLDGIDGDSTVAPIYLRNSYLPELLRTGRWWRFWQELDGHSRRFGSARWKAALKFGLQPWLPAWFIDKVYQWRGTPRVGTSAPLSMDLIQPEFARRLGLIEHFQAQGGYYWWPHKTGRQAHFAEASHGYVGRVEMIQSVASLFAIEFRHPFADRRLLEFCLALPESQKLYQGWNRIIMRRALGDLLPESVRQRPDKAGLVGSYLRPLKHFLAPHIYEQLPLLESYINTTAARNLMQRYLGCNDGREVLSAERIVTLALWLTRPCKA